MHWVAQMPAIHQDLGGIRIPMRSPTDDEVLRALLEKLKRRPSLPKLGECESCTGLMIKAHSGQRFCSLCSHNQTSDLAHKRRRREMRLGQVELVCEVLEGALGDKKDGWEERAIKELVKQGDQKKASKLCFLGQTPVLSHRASATPRWCPSGLRSSLLHLPPSQSAH